MKIINFNIKIDNIEELEKEKEKIFNKVIYNYSTEYNRKLVNEYKEKEKEILMLKTKILCIMGKSGIGKSTLIKELSKNNNFYNVKSFTTREERKNDPNDKNTHIFVTNEKYEKDLKNNKIIALYSSPLGYYSYTSVESFNIEKINLYAIDPIAFNELSKKYNNVYGIYLDLDENERIKRKTNRDLDLKVDPEEHLDKKHLIGDNLLILNIDNKTPKEICDIICNQ